MSALEKVEGARWRKEDETWGRDRLHPNYAQTVTAYRDAYKRFLIDYAGKDPAQRFDLEMMRRLINGSADGSFTGRDGYHQYKVQVTGEVTIDPTSITARALPVFRSLGIRTPGLEPVR